jgi:hypothetical protein
VAIKAAVARDRICVWITGELAFTEQQAVAGCRRTKAFLSKDAVNGAIVPGSAATRLWRRPVLPWPEVPALASRRSRSIQR